MIATWLLSGVVYAFIGAFAGIMAGILGIGGGIIVVPGLALLFQIQHIIPADAIMHVAAGTSLAVMVFTSPSALRVHHKIGEILWSVYHKLWPGLVLGVCLGAYIAQFIPTYYLEIIFAGFLLFVAFKMLTDLHKIYTEHFPANWINRVVSFLIGLKSRLLGVGGGILIIPYLTYCGVSVRKIAPISNLCTLTVGFVGAMVFITTGYKEMAGVPFSSGFVYWPAVFGVAIPSVLIAPLGAKLNYILPVKQLKYGFIVILILTAIKMLF